MQIKNNDINEINFKNMFCSQKSERLFRYISTTKNISYYDSVLFEYIRIYVHCPF